MSLSIEPHGLRLVELLGAISLATDMGTGQPHGHGVRTSVLAVALGRQLGVGGEDLVDMQRVALLRFLGCTAEASDTARLAGGDDVAFMAAMAPATMGAKPEMLRGLIGAVGQGRPLRRRVTLVAGALSDPGGAKRSLSAHCEVAAMLAERLRTGPRVKEALSHGYERWDGAGFPDGLAGEAVPLAVRVAVVARDADLLWRQGLAAMVEMLRARRGRAYDPAVVDACLAVGEEVMAGLDRTDPWEQMLEADLSTDRIGGSGLDGALAAVGDFADLKSVWTRGHSTRVADLAVAAGRTAGMTADDMDRLRRAALVHDVGRVGVPSGIWDRPGGLGVADWERVRLHPYLSERTLTCCPALADMGRLAGAHHERLDGSGYHRGTSELDQAARLLAAADVVAAMGEDRPHRPAATTAEITDAVAAEVTARRLDRAACDAVLAAAGHQPTPAAPASAPAGLTDREIEVLSLIARGRTNKEVATTLHLSAKTVGRHVENVYTKIGVNSRAAAAVFAMEHRLLTR
jgi:HD-GYP domain-containing protein (c-di-GMP phosphodiesterase class II)